jgi:hypothetical protein
VVSGAWRVARSKQVLLLCLATRHLSLATRHSPLATRHSPLVTRHLSLATRQHPAEESNLVLQFRRLPCCPAHSQDFFDTVSRPGVEPGPGPSESSNAIRYTIGTIKSRRLDSRQHEAVYGTAAFLDRATSA